MGTVLYGASLEVDRRLSNRRLQRSDVDRLMVGSHRGFGSPGRIELLLQDGATLLVATEASPLPGQRRGSEQQVAESRSRLDGTPPPYR